MELKTKINAEEGLPSLTITRDFELPVEWLFKAFIEPEFVEQWMGTKVIKLESKNHGSYLFETTDPKGHIHRFNGTIHTCQMNEKITRTFEMENTPFAVQLEFLEFEALDEERSRLTMQIVYKSLELRNQMLQLPFAQGLNMAHNRIQDYFNQIKNN